MDQEVDVSKIPTAIEALRKIRDEHRKRADTLERICTELEELDAPMNRAEDGARVREGKGGRLVRRKGRKPRGAGATIPAPELTEVLKSKVLEELKKGLRPKDVAAALEIPVKFVYAVKYNSGRKGGKG